MSHKKSEIADKIRDGSYFKEARDWYMNKYIYPETERSMMIIFSIVVCLAFIPIADLFYDTLHEDNSISFPIRVHNLTDQIPVIKPLSEGDESSQEAVVRHLISDYVKTREEYFYNLVDSGILSAWLRKIKSSSSKSVLNEYVGYMNERNPYSPRVRYKDHTNRFIDIKSIQFLSQYQTSGTAKVIFEATEEHKSGKKRKELWEVIISFKLPDIAILAKSGAPLRFIVSYYAIKPFTSLRKE